MADVSQEGVIAVLIHEVLHAYIAKSQLFNEQPQKTNTEMHQIFADNYIEPMTEFLTGLYGIPPIDGYALAWSGLGDLYSIDPIVINGVPYNKSDLTYISSKYFGRDHEGKHLAGTDKCVD